MAALPQQGQLTSLDQDSWDGIRIFDHACEENDIEHRLTQVSHPRTNGHFEWMNRTIRDITDKHSHYDMHGQLRCTGCSLTIAIIK